MDQSSSRSWLVIGFFVIVTLVIHLLVSTNYGLHRDAYLYLAESNHLAWGYLSIPPLTPFVAHYWQLLFGSSVIAIRMIPAVIGALCIIIIGKIVKNLGGNIWAIALACLAYLVSPAFLHCNTLLQPVSFNIFFWLLATWVMVRLLNTEDRRWWLALGVILGLGFLNKYSIVFPAFSFVIGLSCTKQRSLFRSRWLLFGIIAGFLIILPNLLWQFNHNWPVAQHMAQLRNSQLVHVQLSGFLAGQLFMILPALPVFFAGLFYVFFDKSARQFRTMGWTFIILVLLLIFLSGKAYYTLGIYPVFFAFGGKAITRYTKNPFKWVRPALASLMILLLLPILPPILSYPNMVRYEKALAKTGFENRWEDGTLHYLPQDYADMTGWKELADIVDSAWNSLSPKEQKTTAIFADNYGEAGAILYFNKKRKLPRPISFNDSFLLWAPNSVHGTTLIYVNDDTSDIRKLFQKVTLTGRVTDPYARVHGMQVYLCQGPINRFSTFYANKVKRLKANYQKKSGY